MVDLQTLKNIAFEFRNSFESVDLSEAPGFLRGFPNGCCSWAVYIVGHFLRYELQLMPVEVQAERSGDNGLESHSWLSVDDIIIDITSDEFEDSIYKTIVSQNSPWHNTWSTTYKEDIPRIETFDQINYGTLLKPSDVYELLASGVRARYARSPRRAQ